MMLPRFRWFLAQALGNTRGAAALFAPRTSARRPRSTLRGLLAAAGAFAVLALLAGCGGGSTPAGPGRMQLDLRPILQQLDGGGAIASSSAAAARTGEVTGPPGSIAVTPVLTLVVGAIVIDFQSTPIGPNVAITDALKTNLKNAAENSVKYLELVPLPTTATTVDFIIPPPAATQWQVVAVGLRDTPATFTDITDDSPIYYGFNADKNGNPFFLSSSTVGTSPIDITMKRACLVSKPPNGCAQFNLDRTFAVPVPAVEIVGIYLTTGSTTTGNLLSSANGGPGSALVVRDSTSASKAQSTIAGLAGIKSGLARANSVQVDTTHQTSGEYVTSGNTVCIKAAAAQLLETTGPATTTDSTTATAGSSTCQVEPYVTVF